MELGDPSAPAPRTYLHIYNLTVDNFDSIHVFTVDVVDHRTLDVTLKIGDGKLWDRETLEYVLVEPLLFSVVTEMRIDTLADGGRAMADDLVKWTLSFTNLTLDTIFSADINVDELLTLRFSQLTKTRCLLAIVDDVEMIEFELGFANADLSIDWTPGDVTPTRTMHEAFTMIEAELPWGSDP